MKIAGMNPSIFCRKRRNGCEGGVSAHSTGSGWTARFKHALSGGCEEKYRLGPAFFIHLAFLSVGLHGDFVAGLAAVRSRA
jgi:hypothetical protein